MGQNSGRLDSFEHRERELMKIIHVVVDIGNRGGGVAVYIRYYRSAMVCERSYPDVKRL